MHKSPAESSRVGVYPGGREGHLPTPKGWGETLTIASAYSPNGSSEYAAFLEVLAWALQGALVGDSVV